MVAGQLYVPQLRRLAERLLERLAYTGLTQGRDHLAFDDQAYGYVTVDGTTVRGVIVCNPPTALPAPELPQQVIPDVPDFYSGFVLGGSITQVPNALRVPVPTLNSFYPTAACAQLYTLATSIQPTAKLAVLPFADFEGDLENQSDAPNAPVYSQYVKLKPTMYSGAMRKVVQFLMGNGFQTKKSLYDTTKPLLTIDASQKPPVTKYQQDVKANGLQIQYDWRWSRTHGIVQGADKTLWLVEIGETRGVVAMQLPMNATSQLPAFRDKLDQMVDSAGGQVVDELGGFPTGESFPTTAVDSWIRAGRIQQLIPMDGLHDFYQHQYFGSFMGWAFADSGVEAHNTAYQPNDDDGFQSAFHYAIRFHFPAVTPVDPPALAAALKARVPTSDERVQALYWKIDHLSDEQAAQFIGLNTTEFTDQLDAYVLPPPSAGTATLRQVDSGRLWKLGSKVQFELKFPQPELGYLGSMDLQPVPALRPFHGRCDTTVHVFFQGEELIYFRFFNDPSTARQPDPTDDSDGCELVGRFTSTVTAGNTFMAPGVYSNVRDDRAELNLGTSTTVTTAVDMGFTSVVVADDIIFPVVGNLSRTKTFRRRAVTDTISGVSQSTAMVVPFDDRCAAYQVVSNGSTASSHTEGSSDVQVGDPNSCNTWRNFPGLTGRYVGGINDGHWLAYDQHPDGCGPVVDRTVASPSPNHDDNASQCALDFVDQGPWCHVCDDADHMTYNHPPPPPAAGVATSTGPTSLTSWVLIAADLLTPLPIGSNILNGPAFPFFIPSPDPDTGITQYAEATGNVLGDAMLVRYSTQPNGGTAVTGGPQIPELLTQGTTFVGVIP